MREFHPPPQPKRGRVHAAEEEMFDRIRQEGLAMVAANLGLDPHELLVRLLRRMLD